MVINTTLVGKHYVQWRFSVGFDLNFGNGTGKWALWQLTLRTGFIGFFFVKAHPWGGYANEDSIFQCK
jgi:hypothetical protein